MTISSDAAAPKDRQTSFDDSNRINQVKHIKITGQLINRHQVMGTAITYDLYIKNNNEVFNLWIMQMN